MQYQAFTWFYHALTVLPITNVYQVRSDSMEFGLNKKKSTGYITMGQFSNVLLTIDKAHTVPQKRGIDISKPY